MAGVNTSLGAKEFTSVHRETPWRRQLEGCKGGLGEGR